MGPAALVAAENDVNASDPVAAQREAAGRFLDQLLILLLMAVAVAGALPRLSTELSRSIESALAALGL